MKLLRVGVVRVVSYYAVLEWICKDWYMLYVASVPFHYVLYYYYYYSINRTEI